MAKSLDRQIAELYGLLKFLELSEEEQERLYAQARAEARARRQRQNARFAAALQRATEVQEARIANLESNNYQAVKLWTNRSTGNIAVMLQRDGVFDQQTSRVRTKLVMVYPDGRYQEAFGKIAIQNDWF